DRVRVELLPATTELRAHSPEQVRSQMRHAHPGQDQEPRLVRDEANVSLPRLARPANVLVSGLEVARCARPEEARDRPAPCSHQILEVLADRLPIAEVVVLLDERPHYWLVDRAPHLAELDWPELAKARLERRGIQQHRLGSAPLPCARDLVRRRRQL